MIWLVTNRPDHHSLKASRNFQEYQRQQLSVNTDSPPLLRLWEARLQLPESFPSQSKPPVRLGQAVLRHHHRLQSSKRQ